VYELISILCDYFGGIIMATFTVSLPKEFERARREFPEANWNELIKKGIMKRLGELKQLDKMRMS